MIEKSFNGYAGSDLFMGSFDYGPAFASYILTVEFGEPGAGAFVPAFALASDVPADGLSWAGGVLTELVLNPAQVALLLALTAPEYRLRLVGGGRSQVAASGTITLQV